MLSANNISFLFSQDPDWPVLPLLRYEVRLRHGGSVHSVHGHAMGQVGHAGGDVQQVVEHHQLVTCCVILLVRAYLDST